MYTKAPRQPSTRRLAPNAHSGVSSGPSDFPKHRNAPPHQVPYPPRASPNTPLLPPQRGQLRHPTWQGFTTDHKLISRAYALDKPLFIHQTTVRNETITRQLAPVEQNRDRLHGSWKYRVLIGDSMTPLIIQPVLEDLRLMSGRLNCPLNDLVAPAGTAASLFPDGVPDGRSTAASPATVLMMTSARSAPFS